MYDVILALHSIMRWIVIIVALVAIARAFVGWFGRKEWTALDNRAGLFFTAAFDLQLLLGLGLIAFSPLLRTAFADFGAAMGEPVLRYWLAEHISVMIVALALAHVGRARSRRAAESVAKHRAAAVWFGIAVLAVLVTVPWPFFPYGRPLFPGLG